MRLELLNRERWLLGGAALAAFACSLLCVATQPGCAAEPAKDPYFSPYTPASSLAPAHSAPEFAVAAYNSTDGIPLTAPENSPYEHVEPSWEEGPTPPAPSDWFDYQFQAVGRGYYENDQRIEFTGQEATFGAEGVLAGSLAAEYGHWTTQITGELFLNQPFDRNIFVDSPIRQSFRGNFEIEPLEISQLYISARCGNVLFALGKMVTPFGRTYFPLYKNDRRDAPFIRTESILWRETGLLMHYEPGPLVATVALVNGSLERDTNSSKGVIARLGLGGEFHALGASVKVQDGIGSETQKYYNRHVGIDAMLCRGPWVLSGEAIYDQYGFRRPFDPLDITWGRSFYNRDQFFAPRTPITGFGYYADLGFQGDWWTAHLNYGEFYPRQIGDAIHDRVTRRGLLKVIRHFTSHLDAYGMVLLENDIPLNQAGRRSEGLSLLGGLQFAL
jgi:hypothetical protein